MSCHKKYFRENVPIALLNKLLTLIRESIFNAKSYQLVVKKNREDESREIIQVIHSTFKRSIKNFLISGCCHRYWLLGLVIAFFVY